MNYGINVCPSCQCVQQVIYSKGGEEYFRCVKCNHYWLKINEAQLAEHHFSYERALIHAAARAYPAILLPISGDDYQKAMHIVEEIIDDTNWNDSYKHNARKLAQLFLSKISRDTAYNDFGREFLRRLAEQKVFTEKKVWMK